MSAVLKEGEWSVARPGRILPPGRSGTHYAGGWMDHGGKSIMWCWPCSLVYYFWASVKTIAGSPILQQE